MIWGAVLGFIIFGALGTIRDAWRHQGPGHVTYEEPDRTVSVTEIQYKRHEYVMGGLMLAVGLYLWIVLAKGERGKCKKPTNQGECEPDGAASGSQPIRSEPNRTSAAAGSRR